MLIGSLDPIAFAPEAWKARADGAVGLPRPRADAARWSRRSGEAPARRAEDGRDAPNRDLWPRDEYAVK